MRDFPLTRERKREASQTKKKWRTKKTTKELQKNKLPLHVCRSRAWSMRHLSFGPSRAPCEPLISPILLQLHWIHSHTQPHTLLLLLSTRKTKIESSKTLTNTNKTPFLCRVVIVPPFSPHTLTHAKQTKNSSHSHRHFHSQKKEKQNGQLYY